MKILPIAAALTSIFLLTVLPAQSGADERDFERRLARVDKGDVDRLLELAEWAKGKKLTAKARLCFRKVVKLEPDNADANLALGRVKVGDRWVPVAMADKARDRLKQRNAANDKGDEAVTSGPIDIELPGEAMAKAKVKGQLLASRGPAEKLKQKFVDSAGVDASTYSGAITDHCQYFAMVNQKDLDTLVQIGEYTLRRLNWIAAIDPKRVPFRADGGRHVCWFTDEETYQDLLAFMHEQYPAQITRDAAKRMLRMADSVGGNMVQHPPMNLSKNPTAWSSTVANGMAHHWLRVLSGNARFEINLRTGRAEGGDRGRGNLLTWLDEGLGIWASRDAIGLNNIYFIARQKYKNVGRARKGEDADYIAMVYDVATNQYGKKARVRSLWQLSRLGVNKFSDLDLAMSWSMIDYMFRVRTSEWRTLIKRLGIDPSFRIAWVATFGTDADRAQIKELRKTKNDRGLEDLYRAHCDRFEAEWKVWVKKTFKEEYEDPTKKKIVEPPFVPIEKGKKTEDKGDDKKKKKKKRKKRRRR